MDQLLAMIIVPPLVGVITYAVLHHLLWKKDEKIDRPANRTNSTQNSGGPDWPTNAGRGQMTRDQPLYLWERKDRTAVTSAFPPLLKREPT